MDSAKVSSSDIEQQKSLAYLDETANELRQQLLIINMRRADVIRKLREDIIVLFSNSFAKGSLHLGNHDLPMESPDALLELATHLNVLPALQQYIDSYRSAILQTSGNNNVSDTCSVSVS